MESNKKQEILFLKGLPASGKTTYAKELVEKGYERVNKDDIRTEYFPDYTFKDERNVIEIEDLRIIDALNNRLSVVVDDTNFNPVHKRRLEQIAREHNVDFCVLFIDTPLEECIKRNRKRPNSVPMEAILDMHRKYIEPLTKEEIKYDDNLEEAIIVDVDGTLAHMCNRNPYDASKAMGDTIDDAVSNIVGMAYDNGYRVIILTGRSEEHKDITEKWLKDNGVNYDEIYTRADNDNRPDYIVKKELFDNNIRNKYNVKYVIDDRPSVCRMWRLLGLKVLQVGDPHYEF